MRADCKSRWKKRLYVPLMSLALSLFLQPARARSGSAQTADLQSLKSKFQQLTQTPKHVKGKMTALESVQKASGAMF